MADVTHEQADLLLKLYDLRREPGLREAGIWFMEEFEAGSMEELMRLCPPGSLEDKRFRMVVSFWDMCASLVNRGLIDEDLYFENVRDQCGVWSLVEPIIADLRAAMKDPALFANLEEHARRFEEWAERRAPGSAAGIREWWLGRKQFLAAAKRGD